MPSNHPILCHPLLLPPSIFPSIRDFSNESILRKRWPKYWSFSFRISPSNEHPGLISFRMDLLDFLAVQGTLQSLLQHHSSKAYIYTHTHIYIHFCLLIYKLHNGLQCILYIVKYILTNNIMIRENIYEQGFLYFLFCSPWM